MSVAVIAGTGVLEFAVLSTEPIGLAGGVAWAGLATAAGILAIRFVINLLERGAFPVFPWLCWGADFVFFEAH